MNRCNICNATLAKCHLCSREWCLDHQDSPLVCPGCGARPSDKAKACKHEEFAVNTVVNRLEDTGRFQADITIKCDQCGTPFRFLGLPLGVDLNSAAVSFDGTEARMAIAPKGEAVPPISGVEGFSVKRAGPLTTG